MRRIAATLALGLTLLGCAFAPKGESFYISRGPVLAPKSAQLMERIGAFFAAANCGYPWDFVDCGLALSSYCDGAAGVRWTYDA